MYSMTGRIRYSEVNSEKTLTLQALMDYLQDCCSFQSEDLGIGVDYLAREHRTWMLGAWQIRLCRMPRMGETIRVNTWPYDFNGFYGYRGFSAEGEDGEVLVLANSLWIFMDTDRMRPTRISEELTAAYRDSFGERPAGGFGERKIALPAEGERREPVAVAKVFIDTNRHMNNSRYVAVAEEFLPEGFRTGALRVEYKRAAVLGDLLYPVVRDEGEKVTIALTNETGGPYAVVEFLRAAEE